jgi:exonuclease III
MNNSARQEEIKQVINLYKPNLVCLQETKMEVINSSIVRNTLGMDFDNNFSIHPALGTRGVILIAARSAILHLHNHVLTNHTITMTISDSRLRNEWMITGVYGPQGDLDKKVFIRELKRLNYSVIEKWLILGDFNLIYKDEDKSNDRLNRRLMLRFWRALNHLEVKEIELTGHKFTWSNGQQNPTLSRIDRACCYPHWEDLFPNPILQALSSSISDHCPILLTPLILPPVRPLFKLELFWTQLQGFQECVQVA